MSDIAKSAEVWTETLIAHYGLSKDTFEDQFKAILSTIFDEIERRAVENSRRIGRMEGTSYLALKDVRAELGIERK